MAQTNYTPIQLYYSTTAAAVPVNTNLLNGELAINITDGKLYYKDNSGTVQVIATKGAGTIGGSTTQIQYNNAGALAGSSAMVFNNSTNVVTLTTLNLTNALGAVYGGTGQSTYTTGDLLYSSAANTLSKLALGTANYILAVNSAGTNVEWAAPSAISVNTATNLAGGLAGSVPYQSGASTTTFLGIGAADRVMTSSGSAPQWVTALTGLTGVSSSSITNTSLTSGRVVYSGASGVQTNSANLTFDGTTLTTAGLSNSGTSALVKLVTVGGTSFSGTTVFAPATPAKLYMGTGTVTDATSAIGATNAVGAVASLAITPIAATNTSVTYTDAATLYIAGAPSAGTNITLTNPYALYIAAGNVYLGGGTANGVAYLNGSKVLTTGSALTFDGTTLGLISSGLNTQNATSDVVNPITASTNQIRMGASGFVSFRLGTAYDFNIDSYNSASPINLYNITQNGTHKWSVSGSEQMRLTSTSLYTASTINVGIGTSSPYTKLDVVQATGGYGGWKYALGANATDFPAMRFLATTANTGNIIAHEAGSLVFLTGTTATSAGSEKLRLDSSGNLGLGVTPSANWGSIFRTMQLGTDGAWVGGRTDSQNQAWIGTNAYYNGSNWIYTTASLAGQMLIKGNEFQFLQAPTGSIGGTANFTQAMTLDASGNLVVGDTSTGRRFKTKFDSNTVYSASDFETTSLQCYINNASSTIGAYTGIQFAVGNNGDAAISAIRTADGESALAFGTRGGGSRLERMRIDSSGNLLVGATSANATEKFRVATSSTEVAFFANDSNTSGYNGIRSQIGSGGNNTSTWHFRGETRGVANWYLYGNGTTSYSSDSRLKKNIETTRDGYLNDLMQLRVVKYNWINSQDTTPKELGLIAQEVEQVFPNLVQEHDIEGVDGQRKHIKHSVMEFILIKAIQELKAEFDAYKASHP